MTNGNTTTAQLDKFFALYDQIPDNWDMLMFFSNEAVGELSELVRWGINWDVYQENFKKYLQYTKIETIGLCPTVSVFTVGGVSDYLEWAFDTVRQYNKKLIITGNWVDGDTILSPAYSNNDNATLRIRKVIIENHDLFVNKKWYDNCLVWVDQLEKIINTKTYTQQQLNDFLDNMAEQKKSKKIYQLLDFIS